MAAHGRTRSLAPTARGHLSAGTPRRRSDGERRAPKRVDLVELAYWVARANRRCLGQCDRAAARRCVAPRRDKSGVWCPSTSRLVPPTRGRVCSAVRGDPARARAASVGCALHRGVCKRRDGMLGSVRRAGLRRWIGIMLSAFATVLAPGSAATAAAKEVRSAAQHLSRRRFAMFAALSPHTCVSDVLRLAAS
jgi:hypothetical protein